MTSDKGGLAFTFDLDVTCEQSEIKKIVKLGERLKEYEDLEEQGLFVKFPCKVGDVVYYRYDGNKIEPMRVEEITIIKNTFILTLRYFGNDETLKYWRIRLDNTAFENKIIFLTKQQSEQALKDMEVQE